MAARSATPTNVRPSPNAVTSGWHPYCDRNNAHALCDDCCLALVAEIDRRKVPRPVLTAPTRDGSISRDPMSVLSLSPTDQKATDVQSRIVGGLPLDPGHAVSGAQCRCVGVDFLTAPTILRALPIPGASVLSLLARTIHPKATR